MNEEVKVIENEETEVVSTEKAGKKGFIKPVLIVGGIAAVVGSVVAIAKKTKDKRAAKRKAKQIAELEKAGYTIIEPEFCDSVIDSDEEVTEE